MPIVKSTFSTNRLIRNGHLQTALPYLFRNAIKSNLFKRERIELDDGDFIDVDFFKSTPSEDLVVIAHGLEGSSDKPYARGQAHYLASEHGINSIAWNMRSCSGEINRKKIFYHAAQTEDIDHVIKYALTKNSYKRIHLVGFSLGGRLTSYYITRVGRKNFPMIRSAACISAPLLLESSIEKLSSSRVGMIYTNVFLRTMKKKVQEKQRLGILDIDHHEISRCKNFLEFDALVTAPHFGFKSASDYYRYASSHDEINNVEIPTLLLQSRDDPFLTRESFPVRSAKKNSELYLEITESGGHLGFMSTQPFFSYWFEKRIADFILSHCHG